MKKLHSWLGCVYTRQGVNFKNGSTRWDRFRCGHIYVMCLKYGQREAQKQISPLAYSIHIGDLCTIVLINIYGD